MHIYWYIDISNYSRDLIATHFLFLGLRHLLCLGLYFRCCLF